MVDVQVPKKVVKILTCVCSCDCKPYGSDTLL